MNAYANYVVSHLLAQSWQIALLAGLVGLISLALRNRSAHLRYLLWLIVLAKCLVPPVLTVPLAVLPERSSIPFVAGVALIEEHSALEAPVSVGGAAQPQELKPAAPSTRELAALVWTAGAFLFLVWVGGRAVRYTAWLRTRRKALPPGLRESVHDSSLGFQFRKWPRIWLLEDISQPFVWGVLRGSVYLPADFVGVSGSDQQRSILAHELSHIARFDASVNLLQVLAQAVYWFHPVVWWANRKIRLEREKCCDEMAVAHLHARPEQYTGAIVDALAAERRSSHPLPSLAIVGSVKDIEERIRTMLRPGKTFRTRPSLMAATVALLIALVSIPTAFVLTARGQAQAPAGNVDKPAEQPSKPATESEQPEQPCFTARTFNAKTAFDVFVRESSESAMKLVGHTPSAAPLKIPACWSWRVKPSAAVQDWDLLVQEINENKVPYLELGAATDSDVQHLARLTELQHLDLSGTQITDASLAYLKGLTTLEQLDLENTRITGASLAHLKGLTGMWGLDLSKTPITDTGLEHLQGMGGLRDLYLDGTAVTDAGLAHLRDLTRLHYLSLDGTRITDAGLAHLRGLTEPRGLYFANTQVTDAGLEHLKGLTGLQYLGLNATQITDAGLEHLKGLTELRWLDLSDTRITDAGLGHLKGLTRLRWLALTRTQLTDAGLEHLKALTGLQGLGLSATEITDAGLEHLRGLTDLQSLMVSNPRITNVGLARLKGLTRLQRLNLNLTRITDAGLENLANLTEMKWLHLSVTRITDSGLAHLKNLTKLEDVGLSYDRITDAGLVHLKGLERLQRLNLSGTQVTEAGVQQLRQRFPKATIERGQLGL